MRETAAYCVSIKITINNNTRVEKPSKRCDVAISYTCSRRQLWKFFPAFTGWKIGKNLLILKNIDRIFIYLIHYFDKRRGDQLKAKSSSWCFLFSLLIISFLYCLPANADGGFIGSEFWDIYAVRQRAFIKYFDHIEDLVIQAAYQGEPQNFSWVVPLPGYPSIKEADAQLFEELHEFTKPRYPRSFCGGINQFKPDAGTLDVIVWETLTVGYFQVAILSSLSGESLVEWLDNNGYLFPDDGGEILDFYTQKGFYFAAFKMLPGTKEEGNLEPVQFTFSTPSPFYPMRMTALSTQGADVLLYMYSDTPLQPDDPNFYSLFEKSVKPSDFSRSRYPELNERCDRAGYLSKWERYFTPEEMVDDINFEQTRLTLGGIFSNGITQGFLIALLFVSIFWKLKRKR